MLDIAGDIGDVAWYAVLRARRLRARDGGMRRLRRDGRPGRPTPAKRSGCSPPSTLPAACCRPTWIKDPDTVIAQATDPRRKTQKTSVADHRDLQPTVPEVGRCCSMNARMCSRSRTM